MLGFDLSNMVEPVYTDAAVEIVPEASLLSEPITIKDIHIPTATVHTLSFSAPFTLVSTSARRKKCRAIVLYFDTFFPGTPEPIKEDEPVHVTRQDEVRLAEVWSIRRRPSTGEGVAFALPAATPSTAPSASASAPLSKMTEEPGTAMESPPPLPRKPSLKRPPSERKDAGVTGSGNATDAPVTRSPPTRSKSLGPPKPETMTSFSTGPASMPTHWKQTVFLLREPINVREG
jgi:protein arginine N-methyltransferase 3